jgi:hypothetical protein
LDACAKIIKLIFNNDLFVHCSKYFHIFTHLAFTITLVIWLLFVPFTEIEKEAKRAKEINQSFQLVSAYQI